MKEQLLGLSWQPTLHFRSLFVSNFSHCASLFQIPLFNLYPWLYKHWTASIRRHKAKNYEASRIPSKMIRRKTRISFSNFRRQLSKRDSWIIEFDSPFLALEGFSNSWLLTCKKNQMKPRAALSTIISHGGLSPLCTYFGLNFIPASFKCNNFRTSLSCHLSIID